MKLKEKLKGWLVAYVKAVNNFVEGVHIQRGGKRTCTAAMVVSAGFLAYILSHYALFINDDTEGWGVSVFIAAIVGSIFLGLTLAFRVHVDERYQKPVHIIFFLLMPVFTMQMLECFNGNFIYIFSVPHFLLNYAAYMILFSLIFVLTGRFRLTTVLVNLPLFLFGLCNYYVDTFRGTPIVPMDIFSIGTGLNVASAYSFTMSWQIILAVIVELLILSCTRMMVNIRPQRVRTKRIVRATVLAYFLIIGSTVYGSDVLADHGFKPDFWDQSRGYHNSGIWYNFCLNTKYLHVSEPEGYSEVNVEDVATEYLTNLGVDSEGETSIDILTGENTYTPTGEHPNIIAIMNESWADLESLGDLRTNVEIMPFINSLSENVIKGTLTVPVFGAGTANSEFEFLTGNSISFLPKGASVYESYINHAQPSLVSTLSAQGYSKTALHPYYASGWNRPSVYNYMGFNTFVTMEDVIDADILETYKEDNDSYALINRVNARYPGEKMLIRRYISDSYNFKLLEEQFEAREEGQPFFLFNVTMQNHGGYDMSYINFTEDVSVLNTYGYYPKAQRYLSLIKQTDAAFQELIEYFEQVEEPTIILMFGDHQPSIENAFYTELFGKSLDDLTPEESQKRYQTPFLIWANYDIEEATVDQISANYLSTLLLQVAGQELPTYNKYLAALYQELPVVTTTGYVGADNVVYDYNDSESPYATLINEYYDIMYNNLLDTSNRAWTIYTIDGLEIPDPDDDDNPLEISASEEEEIEAAEETDAQNE